MSIYQIIKSNTSILDLEKIYPELIKFKDNKCVSPFNPSERTPSFICDPESNIVSCFSQGKLGLDIIAAVSEIDGVSPYEAAIIINEKLDLGLDLGGDFTRNKEEDNYSDMFNSMSLSSEAIEYLKSRGITEQYAIEYGIKSSKDRIYLPLYAKNSFKRIIGYNARALDNNTQPKYLLSKGLNKTGYLGNIKHALSIGARQTLPYVILTEGMIDCIPYNSIKIPCVSCLGRSASDESLSILLSSFNTIYISMDNDSVGRQASIDLYKQIKNINTKAYVQFLDLLEFKDLNEYFVSHAHTGSPPFARPDVCTLSEWWFKNMGGHEDVDGLLDIIGYSGRLSEVYMETKKIVELWEGCPYTQEDFLRSVRAKVSSKTPTKHAGLKL